MNPTNLIHTDLLSVFENLPDAYALLSPEFIILSASEPYLSAIGTSRLEITGKHLPEIVSSYPNTGEVGLADRLRTSLQEVLSTGKPRELTLPQYTITGSLPAGAESEETGWQIVNTPVSDERGAVLYIIHKLSRQNHPRKDGQPNTGSLLLETSANGEASERQKMEARVKEYGSLFESMDQGFCVIEIIFDKDNQPIDYRFLGFNAAFEKQTGLKEAAGKTARELVPNLEKHWFERYGKVALTGKPARFAEGSEAMGRWFEVNAYRLGSNGSRKVALLFADISARRQAEIKLRESEQRFSSIFNQTSVGIAQTDLEGKFMLVNGRYCEIVGWSEGELYHMHMQNITHPDDLQANIFLLEMAITKGTPFSIEKRYRRGDGTYIWVNVNVSTVKDTEGKPLYIVGVCQDITAHKTAVEALKGSQNRLSHIVEASNDGIWDWDSNKDKAWWNHRYTEILGVDIPQDERGLRAVNEYIHPDDRQLLLDALDAHLERGEKYEVEFRFVRPSGEIRHVLTKGKAVRDEQGNVLRLSGILTDITERKKAEEALRESENLFRTFANHIQNLAWMAAPDGWIYWYNQRWYEYTGTTYEEMQGWGWEKVHHPDYKDWVVAFVKEAWGKGETFELTFPLRGTDGGYRWFLTRAYAVKDTGGRVVNWIGTNTDIDDQKMAEASLAQKNKELTMINNDLDNFIYTASHDLRAPISNIEGLMQAIFRSLSPEGRQNPAVVKFGSLITDSIERFKRTLNDLTQITKIGRESLGEDFTEVDLSTTISEVRLDLAPQIEQADVLFEINMTHCTPFPFSAKNARSIVYNLLSNAIKYRSPERRAFIRVACYQEDAYLVLSVEDNGLGMDLSHKNKIFGMFQRLHDHVEGSGVGLYIVKKIIENAGGKIDVQSRVGQGSIFWVYFRQVINT
jgi:PAS domain S-box-containing protein